MLERWKRQARQANVAHLRATDSLAWRNFGLGVTATIFATAVGSGLFATLQKDVTVWVRAVAASVSVIAAILSSLQSSLRYGSRAETHRRAARAYGNVVRQIEELEGTTNLAPAERQQHIDAIRSTLDQIDRDAPNVSSYIWAWAVSSVGKGQTSGRDPSTIDRGIWPRIYWTLKHRLPE